MKRIAILSLALCLTAVSGCHCGCCSKRDSEMSCPTDIRQTHFWCFGEDALIHCPCGPKAEYYGYEPTCWRDWPTTSAQWRDAFCPPLGPGTPCQEEMWYPPTGEDAAMPTGAVPANPFNDEATTPNEPALPHSQPVMMNEERQPLPLQPVAQRGHIQSQQLVSELQRQATAGRRREQQIRAQSNSSLTAQTGDNRVRQQVSAPQRQRTARPALSSQTRVSSHPTANNGYIRIPQQNPTQQGEPAVRGMQEPQIGVPMYPISSQPQTGYNQAPQVAPERQSGPASRTAPRLQISEPFLSPEVSHNEVPPVSERYVEPVAQIAPRLLIRDRSQLDMSEVRHEPLGRSSRRSAFQVQQPSIMDGQPIQWSGIR